MNIIRALLVVLGCLALGEAAVWILGLKLPGSIVGMGLLRFRPAGSNYLGWENWQIF